MLGNQVDRGPQHPFVFPVSRSVPKPPKVTLSWNAVSGMAGYKLGFGTASLNYSSIIDVAGNTSKVLGGLVDGQIYFASVWGYNSRNILSPLSDEINWRMPYAAQQYHVTTTGNASGNGSLTRPWDLQTAMNSAVPGDTVYVHGGTYVGAFSIGVSGTAGKIITFRNAPGENPIIQNNAGGSFAILNNGHPYIRIEGFECTTAGTGAAGIFLQGECHHNEIVGNNCHHYPGSGSSGIWVQGPTVAKAFGLVANNKCHDNDGGGITLWIFSSGYWQVCSNEAYLNKTQGNFDGIQIGGGSGGGHHVVVRRNYSHDNNVPNTTGGDQLDCGGHTVTHHYCIEENLIIPNTGHGAVKCQTGGDAGSGGTWTDGISGHAIFRGNIIQGTELTAYTFPNTTVHYNNTWIDPFVGIEIYNASGFAPGTWHLGDSTYATWIAAKSLTETDTGRFCVKNNVTTQFVDGANFYLIMTNDNQGGGVIIGTTYADVRYRGNWYKFATNSRINWSTLLLTNGDTGFSTYQSNFSPNLPDVGSQKFALATLITAIYTDPNNGNYSPAAGASHIGTCIPLTTAIGSGTNSTSLTADRASYFMDGYNSGGETVINADWIKIGNGLPVQIQSIGESTDPNVFNVITLTQPRSWNNGDEIQLWDPIRNMRRYADPGAIDTQGGQPRPAKVTGLSYSNIVP